MRTATLAVLGLLSFAAAALAAPISDIERWDRQMQPPPPGPAVLGRQLAEDWQARLKEVDADLRRGDWPAGRQKSQTLVREMFERIIDGESAAPLLATAVLLRGLAAAGTGDRDAGMWDWFIAQNLYPDLRRTSLDPYGEPGKLFGEHRLAVNGQLPAAAKEPPLHGHAGSTSPTAAPKPPDPDLTRPIVREQPKPAYPPALNQICRKGKVIVGSVIEKSGEPSYPVVLLPGDSPVMTFSTLEALRGWRFEPAKFKGEPVRAIYTLTVNYMIPHCYPRRF
jgi:hypothetical protein